MGKEYSHVFRSIIAGGLPYILYKPNLSPEVKEKINQTKRFLRENLDWSLMVYGNHQTKNDPLWDGAIAHRLDPKQKREMFALVSDFHTRAKTGEKKSGMSLMSKLSEKCGVKMIPVVQTYQVNNPEYNYSSEDAFKSYKGLITDIKNLRGDEKKGVTGIIKIEGTRSVDGILLRGESGIEKILEMIKPVVIVPVANFSDEKLERDAMNFGKRVDINLGEIIFYDGSNKDIKKVGNLMDNLAMALPPEMRGQYGEKSK